MRRYHINLFMANYEIIFVSYQKKKKGVRLLNFFDVKESLVAAGDSILVRELVSKRESTFTLNLNSTEYIMHVYQMFIFFLNNSAG